MQSPAGATAFAVAPAFYAERKKNNFLAQNTQFGKKFRVIPLTS
jgi:hypothetical protein